MNKIRTICRILVLVTSGLVLAACSREPSEEDIRLVYEAEVAGMNEQMVSIGGKHATEIIGKSELHAVKKLGCKAAEDKSGFNCDVQVDMSMPLLGRSTQTRTERFVKGENGWVVVGQ